MKMKIIIEVAGDLTKSELLRAVNTMLEDYLYKQECMGGHNSVKILDSTWEIKVEE